MRTSEAGLDFVKGHEGLRLQAYYDPTGTLTIGYGHTATVQPGQVITLAQARELLRNDLRTAEMAVTRHLISKGVRLSQNEFDALVSLVFNAGEGNIFLNTYNNGFAYGSSLYNKILRGNKAEAAAHFMDWTKSKGVELPGLVRRRREEMSLFKKKVRT